MSHRPRRHHRYHGAASVSRRDGRRASHGNYAYHGGPAASRKRRANSAMGYTFAPPDAINREAARHRRGDSVDHERQRLRQDARHGRRAKGRSVRQDARRIRANLVFGCCLIVVRATIGPILRSRERRTRCHVKNVITHARRGAYGKQYSRVFVSVQLPNRICEHFSRHLHLFQDDRNGRRSRTKAGGRMPQNFNQFGRQLRRRDINYDHTSLHRRVRVEEVTYRQGASGICRIVANGHRDRNGHSRRSRRFGGIRLRPIGGLRRWDRGSGYSPRSHIHVTVGRHFGVAFRGKAFFRAFCRRRVRSKDNDRAARRTSGVIRIFLMIRDGGRTEGMLGGNPRGRDSHR